MSFKNLDSYNEDIDLLSIFDPTYPEKCLFAAMLERALRDIGIITYDFIDKQNTFAHRRSALTWINSMSDRVFGFEWICEQLAISPTALRRKLGSKLYPDSTARIPYIRRRSRSHRGNRFTQLQQLSRVV